MYTLLELQNEEYFTYCQDEGDLVSSGELTGTYLLCEHIKCENFQAVICIDTKQVYSAKPKFEISLDYKNLKGETKKITAVETTQITGMPAWKKIIGWFIGLF